MSTAVEPGQVAGRNREEIRAALQQADANVLRMAMYQLTGDPVFAEMRIEQVPARGGVLMMSALAPEHHEQVRERALEFLLAHNGELPPIPTAEQQHKLLEMFSGDSLTPSEGRFAMEELALAENPRAVEWNAKPSDETLRGFTVWIIGAGVSAISLAVQLKHLGVPFQIADRQDRLGGTWARNEYPGIRVDVNAFLYQFKFEKRYPWTQFFPQGAEIRSYLEHIVDKYDLRSHIRLSTEVTTAQWDESAARWNLGLKDASGAEDTVAANVLISASGLFNAIKIPDIAGLDSFKGPMFHTASWDKSFDPAGKDIAVIGNGSSGVQVMPVLAEDAGHLTVYQRTPQWISAMENYTGYVSPEQRWVIDNVPYYWNWLCYNYFSAATKLQPLQEYDAEWRAKGGIINERNDKLREGLKGYIETKLGGNTNLIAKSMPTIAPLARRPVVDNGWYDALLRDNVELVVDPIDRITPKGILTKDGVEREFDAIVLGTGFAVSQYMWPVQYRGRGGVSLEQQWDKDGARAYLGMMMPNFPNMFIFYGPNGQPRAGGFHSWAEIWARYIAQSIVLLLEGGYHAMEVKAQISQSYNDRMDAENKKLIWEVEGAAGYYVNEKGRSGVNMPWRIDEYYRMVEHPDPADFDLS